MKIIQFENNVVLNSKLFSVKNFQSQKQKNPSRVMVVVIQVQFSMNCKSEMKGFLWKWLKKEIMPRELLYSQHWYKVCVLWKLLSLHDNIKSWINIISQWWTEEKENGMARMVNRWTLVKKRRREILDLFLLSMQWRNEEYDF